MRRLKKSVGSVGGQVVSVLTFYSDDPSSNSAKVYSFLLSKLFENNESKKRGRGWPTLKKI